MAIGLAMLLRQEVENSELSWNAIAVEAKVPGPVLWRFMTNPDGQLNTATADKLMNFLRLEVRKRKA